MAVAGYTDIPLEVFGGQVTDVSASELPAGVSPDCQDIAFELAGAVKTRPGLAAKVSGLTNNVNYLKSYIPQPGSLANLVLDSSGALNQETSDGVKALISASACAANSYCKSASQFASATSQFAKEWLAFSDGKFGVDIPRQWDNANFDRVSQVGPGGPPTAADSGVAGNIVAGVHKVSVIFKTRQGYLTQPSPPFTTWTAGGSKKLALSAIPTGPSNVVSRIICITTAGGNNYYYTNGQLSTQQMEIFDNTTTATTGAAGALPDFDFTDAQLTSGISVDYLFSLVELGEAAGVVDYNGRLIWWGVRNKLNNFINLTFDGGFNGNLPLGWTLDVGGGTKESTNVVWGDAYKITGDGVTGNIGAIHQTAYQDYNGVPIIRPNIGYSVRARIRNFGSPAAGAISFILNGTGVNNRFTVTFAQTTTAYQEFIGVLTTPLTSVPSDLLFYVQADNSTGAGIIPAGKGFYIDNIEVFPTNQPVLDSTLFCSRVFDPESYIVSGDNQSGLIPVALNNGQRITSVYRIKERLFIAKEHGLFSTQDTGNSSPVNWTVTEISNKVGTSSINGVAVGEDFAILADRSGAYITDGGEPRKLSQVIQPTWATNNNNALHTMWTALDTNNRRVLIGAPTGAATSPNKIFVLDYRGQNSAADIAAAQPVDTFLYTGALRAFAKTTRWVPWNITANSGAMLERFDGSQQVAIGNGSATGKFYLLSDTQFSDDGIAINGYYITYLFPTHEQEQQYQMSRHRKLAAYLTLFVEGSGTLNLSAFAVSLSAAAQPIPALTLSNPALRDLERQINVLGERIAFKIGTNAVGAWFKLQRLVPAFTTDPAGPVRGV